jgi:uncharacterized protein (DUF1697 family)
MVETLPSMRLIAFLRAINVGGHVVKMDRLRGMFEALGFSGVETFIASGNVVFETRMADTAMLERKIESHLRKALGYEVATFLRSADEVAEVAKYRPFTSSGLDADGNSLYVAFLPAPPERQARKKLLTFRTDDDDLHTHRREVYWLRRKSMSESAFSGALLEKTVGMKATMRNVTTIRRLAARYPRVGPKTGGPTRGGMGR